MPARTPEELCSLFELYMAEGDLESLLGLYDVEAVLLDQSGELRKGREEIGQQLAPMAAAKTAFAFNIRQVIPSGDIALMHTHWKTPLPEPRSEQHAIEVARRQADGTWRWLIGDPFTVGKNTSLKQLGPQERPSSGLAGNMNSHDQQNTFGSGVRLKSVQLLTIMLFALVMGVFWGTWFSLSRTMADLPAQTFLDVGHSMIRNLGGPMSILMPLSLLSAAIVLILLPKRSRSFALASAGLLLMVLALVITLAIEVPIDNKIQVWEVATLPPDWSSIRDRWQSFHALRTFASIAALALVVASTLGGQEAPSTRRDQTHLPDERDR